MVKLHQNGVVSPLVTPKSVCICCSVEGTQSSDKDVTAEDHSQQPPANAMDLFTSILDGNVNLREEEKTIGHDSEIPLSQSSSNGQGQSQQLSSNSITVDVQRQCFQKDSMQ